MTKKIYSTLIVAFVVVAAAIGWQINHSSEPLTDAMVANIEALTYVENIGGTYYIFDQIPCASSATEYRVDQSYVNCTDCKQQAGKAEDLIGNCTTWRELKP